MDTALRKLFASYARETRGGKPIDRRGAVRVNIFLDLLSAVHDPESLKVLASALVTAVSADSALGDYATVVGPKNGNCLLAREVADSLNKKTAFVRDSILFGKWVEGSVRPGDIVIVVDDVGADPEVLCEAVQNLRRDGVYTAKVWVLVNRKEFKVERALALLGTRYGSVCELGDDDLRDIIDS